MVVGLVPPQPAKKNRHARHKHNKEGIAVRAIGFIEQLLRRVAVWNIFIGRSEGQGLSPTGILKPGRTPLKPKPGLSGPPGFVLLGIKIVNAWTEWSEWSLLSRI